MGLIKEKTSLSEASVDNAAMTYDRSKAETDAPAISVTICGSFRRGQDQLHQAHQELLDHGCIILSPKALHWVAETEGFVFAEHELHSTPAEVEERHLKTIDEADMIWLHNPDGHLGISAAVEIGYAHAVGTPVFSQRPLHHQPGLAGLIKVVSSPAAAVQTIQKALPEER